MASRGQLLQDPFLNAIRKEHIPVSIYLVNGIKLQGQIESFDQYVVLLRNTVTHGRSNSSRKHSEHRYGSSLIIQQSEPREVLN